MKTLMAANVNELLDWCESPETLLKQVIRDRQHSLQQLRMQAVEAITLEKQLSRQVMETRQMADRWQKIARDHLQSDREDLARKALVQRMQSEAVLARVTEEQCQATSVSEQFKQQVSLEQCEQADARGRLSSLLARARIARAAIELHSRESAGTVFPATECFWRERLQQDEWRAEALQELETAWNGEPSPPGNAGEIEAALVALREEIHHGAA